MAEDWSDRTARKCGVWWSCLVQAMLFGGLLMAVAQSGESWPARPPEKKTLWVAPDSTWRMLGFRQYEREYLREHLAKRPGGIVEGLMYEKVVEEDGDWYVVRVNFMKGKKVTFTRNTKIVVTHRGGKKVESEAICCWPDRLQTAVYDTRVSPVVLTERSVWCGDNRWGPFGAVKFPVGSISLDEIESFEVVGAIPEVATERLGERR